MNPSTILFVSLAGNQALFYEVLGREMESLGWKVVHACFHEGSVREMRARKLEVFNPFELHTGDIDAVSFDDYGVRQLPLLIGHEKAAYGLRDTMALERKLKGHLHAMGQVVDQLLARGERLVLVQELGGFTSVLASYFAARRRGVDNWFIEPSFFSGRVFFTRNSFRAPAIPAGGRSADAELIQRLAKIVETQAVVIPDKDRSHYRGALSKLGDPRNIRRLIEKIGAKYLRGEREEFEHIGGHVLRHLRMARTSLKLKPHYRGVPTGRPFLYYPLHVPADFALTIRSPEYLDQYALIDYIARIAPAGHLVAIKEHPALVGAVEPYRMLDLLGRHDNLVLLEPGIKNHTVLAQCEAVVTVNSKSGAEALLHNKPVFALGDSFYRDCPLVEPINSLAELPEALAAKRSFPTEELGPFFQQVWDRSYPGELYGLAPRNLRTFADSLASCLAENSAQTEHDSMESERQTQ